MTSFLAILAAHLWQSTLFVGVAALLTLLLRANHAKERHAIWLAASLKFLVPFAALSAIGRQFAWRTADAVVHPALVAAQTVTAPFSGPDFGPIAIAAARVAPPASLDLSPLVVSTWIAGVLLLLGVWSFRWRKLSAMLRIARPVTHGRELEILRRVERGDSRSRETSLLASDHSLEPGVIGWVNPVILWPSGISGRLSDEQIEAILLHELAHVKRRDNLLALGPMCVQALFWFHPLVWWIGARLVDERERACDEEVVRLGADPEQYAEGILRTCEYAVESPLACVAGVTGSDLKRRVIAIVANRPAAKLGSSKLALLTAIGLLFAAGPIVAGALTTKTESPMAATKIETALLEAANNRPETVGLEADTRPARQLEIRAIRSGPWQPDISPTRTRDSEHMPDSQMESLVMMATRRLGPDSPAATTITTRLAPTVAQAPAQSATAPAATAAMSPKFEVASIKLYRDAAERPIRVGAVFIGRFTQGSSLRFLIQQAYQIPFVQQIGGPDWIRQDTWEVNAKAPDDVKSTPANLQSMIRALLADRFRLVVHEEQRDMPVYALVHARTDQKLGPKLQASNCPPPVSGQPRTIPPNTAGLKWEQGPRCGQMQSSPTRMLVGGFPIGRLTELLQSTLGRPVVDRTGLAGDFDLELTYGPQQPQAGGADSDGPSIFTAIQEQLGLKLESERASVRVLVIDSVQRPTED